MSLNELENGIIAKAKSIERGQWCFLGSLVALFLVLFVTLAGIVAGVTPFIPEDSTNRLPIPNAGIDQMAFENETVTLDASTSRDPDGNLTSYLWE